MRKDAGPIHSLSPTAAAGSARSVVLAGTEVRPGRKGSEGSLARRTWKCISQWMFLP